MLAALADDFAALDGVSVTTLLDGRLRAPVWTVGRVVTVDAPEEERCAFDRIAGEADYTIVIAPECGGWLLDRCRRVVSHGGRLLGPDERLVALASDKHATIERLAAAGVEVPRGRRLKQDDPWPHDLPYPLVAKPCDGAGSQGVRRIEAPPDRATRNAFEWPIRLECFCPGVPASVAFICGPAGAFPLPPCSQTLTSDGRFVYLGGSAPMAPPLAARATRLAVQAVSALPRTFGYLGVDLILGPADDGSDDVVVEINPRLTTSYVGLRRLMRENLAALLLHVAEGGLPDVSAYPRMVTFTAEGQTSLAPRPCPAET